MHIYAINNANGTKVLAKLTAHNGPFLEWNVRITEKLNNQIVDHYAGRYHVDAFSTAYEAAHTVNARLGCLTGA